MRKPGWYWVTFKDLTRAPKYWDGNHWWTGLGKCGDDTYYSICGIMIPEFETTHDIKDDKIAVYLMDMQQTAVESVKQITGLIRNLNEASQ